MKKRVWSVLLTFALLASLLPWAALPARAEEPAVYTSYTADASDGGDCWGDGAYNNLVDNDKSTKWGCSFNGTRYVDFHSAAPIVPTGYVLTTGADAATSKGRNPKDWKIYAKKTSDAAEWTVLAEVTNDATMEDIETRDYSFTLANSEAWQYFRFEVSAVRGNPNDPSDHTFQLAELQFTIADTHDLASASIEGLQATYPYTGEDIELAYTVKAADGTVLREGTDYDAAISPSPVRAVGDYTLTLTGKGDYSGTKTASFSVVGQEAAPSWLKSGDTVWFGVRAQRIYTDVSNVTEYKPVAWRVLSPAGDETLPVSDAAHTLLISRNTLGYGIEYGAFSETVPDPWHESSAKKWCDDLWEHWDTSGEDAIAETRLTDKENYQGGFNNLFEYGPAPLWREHFFFLSAEEADTYFKDDADRVAYRADECSSAAIGRNPTDWWLRSPVCSASEVLGFKKPAAGAVSERGWVNWACTGGQTPMRYDARPAFNLDMSRVFFATAAVGGKASSDGSFVTMENTTHEWKLTLRFDAYSGLALAETAPTAFVGGRVTLHYSGVLDMEGMSVSALLYDEKGERIGYASEPAETASGTAVFTLPNDLEPGCYHLKVFSEKRFGDCKTDLAGSAVTVDLTVLPAPSVKGGTLSGQVYELGYTVKNAPEGALLIGALYDGSGHLREVKTVSVRGDVQDRFYMRNVKDPVSVLMLVDSKTYAPLCPAWEN